MPYRNTFLASNDGLVQGRKMSTPISSFRSKKNDGKKITMLTCYDFPTARLQAQCGIDILLVGDSLGTNVLGYTSITEVTLDDMVHHLGAVRRGAPQTPVLCDMPYRTYETPDQAYRTARVLVDHGADAVKLEGSQAQTVSFLVDRGIPVCGHVGFTPQTGGGKASVQGKTLEQAQEIYSAALEIDRAGAFMLVLELVPEDLAAAITDAVSCPTIGIGAGRFCDGQVQVVYDILGISERIFRHAQCFGDVGETMQSAICGYAEAVRDGQFPSEQNTGVFSQEVREKFAHWVSGGRAEQ